MAKKPKCLDLKVSDYDLKVVNRIRRDLEYSFYEKYDHIIIHKVDYCVIFYAQVYSYYLSDKEAPNYTTLYKSSKLTGTSWQTKKGYTEANVYQVHIIKSNNICDIVENKYTINDHSTMQYSNLGGYYNTEYYIHGRKVEKYKFDEEYENKRLKNYSIIKRLEINTQMVNILKIKEHKTFIEINNPLFYEAYYKELEKATSDSINKYEIKTLFHGTNHNNAISILYSGFHASKNGALGPGVYAGLIDKAKSFAICRKSTYEHQNLIVLEIEVLFKNLLILNNSYVPDKHSNFDIEYDGFQRKEWVIRNAHRVLLKKIHYL